MVGIMPNVTAAQRSLEASGKADGGSSLPLSMSSLFRLRASLRWLRFSLAHDVGLEGTWKHHTSGPESTGNCGIESRSDNPMDKQA
jgi:hypothetical protein